VRLVARGATPLGAIFLACGLVAAAVGLLHLDRLPVTFCAFKAVTGIPCLGCGRRARSHASSTWTCRARCA
jgi:hypothetical protein